MSSAKRVMIVMYHYVRRIAGSRFPAIKGRETAEFAEQIAYLQKHHRIIDMRTLIAALADGADGDLPDNAIVLTFDDGYRDHFSDAFPVLAQAGTTGTFFVPECVVTHRRMLDVNKVHFVLANAPDPALLADAIDRELDASRAAGAADLREPAAYHREFRVASRFDTAEVIYVKRMLQHALPLPLRTRILDDLFRRWVSGDEADFAGQLYMSEAELVEMREASMLIGAHGANHLWMNRCDAQTQRREIDLSAALLERLGVPAGEWTFCYPYGAYNADTLALVRARGFRAGVTTAVDLLEIQGCNPLLMPRLDTNDLPILSTAEPNSWSRRLAETAAH
jgi:peptidoglycan/xylan/chitin deacetylase (PgdA/CDA1 family)